MLLTFVTVIAVVVVIAVVLASNSKAAQQHTSMIRTNGLQGSGTQVGYTMNGQPIYQQSAPPGTNVFAVMALVLGIFTGLFGIIFGHIALSQIKRTGERGSGMALTGLILGYVWLAFWALTAVGLVARFA
ncbi:DUF4190 domain-containing protein [Glutamicibacter sp. PS]|uniref:DUF4190 domain-containing protein n=1 Tax=Glutamicibacter sp. PS TaxID=3075634 RepID=UPI00284A1822|nr:DUF4190 domain-containing protein [Glutamicibacter sp. PS]MDR4533083.1 DUF4190 domain-containing protein [Glutamicibacter sp. PS]